MNASAALLSGLFVAGTVKTSDAVSAEKGERLLGAIAGTLAMKLRNRGLWSLPWQSDPPEP
jgi:hypothetical protein